MLNKIIVREQQKDTLLPRVGKHTGTVSNARPILAEVITNTINFLADLVTKRAKLHTITSTHYSSAAEFRSCKNNTAFCQHPTASNTNHATRRCTVKVCINSLFLLPGSTKSLPRALLCCAVLVFSKLSEFELNNC